MSEYPIMFRCPSCGASIQKDPNRNSMYEDTAKLEEIRLKYELEERKRQENNESKRNVSKSLKIKRWISWLLCVASLCIGMFTRNSNSDISVVFGVLFFAFGIYAIVISITSIFKKR